jgi:hypothetical protein
MPVGGRSCDGARGRIPVAPCIHRDRPIGAASSRPGRTTDRPGSLRGGLQVTTFAGDTERFLNSLVSLCFPISSSDRQVDEPSMDTLDPIIGLSRLPSVECLISIDPPTRLVGRGASPLEGQPEFIALEAVSPTGVERVPGIGCPLPGCRVREDLPGPQSEEDDINPMTERTQDVFGVVEAFLHREINELLGHSSQGRQLAVQPTPCSR